MKIWLLQPNVILPKGENPWDPWYDKAFGFVVRAESEELARELATAEQGDEGRGEFFNSKIANTRTPWADPKYSTCKELPQDGDAGVIIRDFASA